MSKEIKINQKHFIYRDPDFDMHHRTVDEAILEAKNSYRDSPLVIYQAVAIVGTEAPDNIPVKMIPTRSVKNKKPVKKKGKK